MGGRLGTDSQFLETLFSAGIACGLTDAQLLERFVTGENDTAEAAFEGLVLRHGPMVFDVCLKILANTHDAQDAFQATFLILATRARSIMRGGSVGSWLHGVALRVARRARSDSALRIAQERQMAERTRSTIAPETLETAEDFEALHDEVDRLPHKYREAVVLCYVEGMSLEAAARQLGCPIGTIGVRLMRARERLKNRLIRRGMCVPAGLVVAGIASKSASAALPGDLVRSTVRAAVHGTKSGIVSLVATKLTTDVLRGTVMIKLVKSLTGLMVATVAVGFVAGSAVQSGLLNAGQPQTKNSRQAPASLIGKKVVTKYFAPIMAGNEVADIDGIFRVYSVTAVDVDRARLVSDDVSGWVELSKIVLFDDAIDFYTNELAVNPTAEAYCQRGLIRVCLDDHRKAIADFTDSIRLNPKNSYVYLNRGKSLQLLRNYENAIADYDQVILLDPKWGQPYQLRGDAWFQKGSNDKAIDDLTEAIRLGAGDWYAYRTRGLAWLNKKESDKAISDLTEAIELDPKNVEVRYSRGRALLEKQELEKAIADFSETVRLDPKNDNAYRDRGYCWWSRGDADKAIADLDQAVRLNPQNADNYFGRANAWASQSEFHNAIADYDRALKVAPNHSWAISNRGMARLELGQLDAAIADFDAAIKLDPTNAQSYNERGLAWFNKGGFDAAIRDFTEGIRLDPKQAYRYNNRARAWLKKGEREKALIDFDEAVSVSPDSAFVYRWRAEYWYTANDFDRTVADLDQAIRLDPSDPWSHALRGEARVEKKEYDKAIADFDDALRLNPSDAGFRANYIAYRGGAWRDKREFDKAIADFAEAVRLEPDEPFSYRARAWIWATCTDEHHRDGARAVESATKACELTKWNEIDSLETLAAACAEAGDFESAQKWQIKANELGDDDDDKSFGEARLKLYQDRKPYRDDNGA